MNEVGYLLATAWVGVFWMGNSDDNFGNVGGGGFRLLLGVQDQVTEGGGDGKATNGHSHRTEWQFSTLVEYLSRVLPRGRTLHCLGSHCLHLLWSCHSLFLFDTCSIFSVIFFSKTVLSALYACVMR